jgi:hypothetical protein
MNVEIRRQNIIILFWKKRGGAVSFLGIHKLEPDTYIGFSPAFHLQCTLRSNWYVEIRRSKENHILFGVLEIGSTSLLLPTKTARMAASPFFLLVFLYCFWQVIALPI